MHLAESDVIHLWLSCYSCLLFFCQVFNVLVFISNSLVFLLVIFSGQPVFPIGLSTSVLWWLQTVILAHVSFISFRLILLILFWIYLSYPKEILKWIKQRKAICQRNWKNRNANAWWANSKKYLMYSDFYKTCVCIFSLLFLCSTHYVPGQSLNANLFLFFSWKPLNSFSVPLAYTKSLHDLLNSAWPCSSLLLFYFIPHSSLLTILQL